MIQGSGGKKPEKTLVTQSLLGGGVNTGWITKASCDPEAEK